MQSRGMGVEQMDIMAVPYGQKRSDAWKQESSPALAVAESQKSYHFDEIEHGKLRQEQR